MTITKNPEPPTSKPPRDERKLAKVVRPEDVDHETQNGWVVREVHEVDIVVALGSTGVWTNYQQPQQPAPPVKYKIARILQIVLERDRDDLLTQLQMWLAEGRKRELAATKEIAELQSEVAELRKIKAAVELGDAGPKSLP
jgi:hypothetical protein